MLDRKILEEIINRISNRTGIRPEILEKDYYVCLVLRDLASRQNELKAYFKGGTALYKILKEFHRFSEDIDLTVLQDGTNANNRKRLKDSVLKYDLPGLKLDIESKDDRKASVSASYLYSSIFSLSKLYKTGRIEIESTSFTISEPIGEYEIEYLIYQEASKEEKEKLEELGIRPFGIKTVKLERIFIDKIFATEFYLERKEYGDVSKHLYDIVTLLKRKEILELLDDRKKLAYLIGLKRNEEKRRSGGVSKKLKICDFKYFKQEMMDKIYPHFDDMQKRYIITDDFIMQKDKLEKGIKFIKEKLKNF